MKTILQVDFAFAAPEGPEAEQAMKDLAESINKEPGMIWKIWTQDPPNSEAGGIYLFQDRDTAQQYLDMHSARLTGFGVENIRAKLYDINEPLTAINQGPVS